MVKHKWGWGGGNTEVQLRARGQYGHTGVIMTRSLMRQQAAGPWATVPVTWGLRSQDSEVQGETLDWALEGQAVLLELEAPMTNA